MEQSALPYVVLLVKLLSPGNRYIVPLINAFGSPAAVFDATEDQLLKVSGLPSHAISKIMTGGSLLQVESILGYCDENDIRLITYWDEDYPENLKSMSDPPALLFCKGQPIWKDAFLSIAIAGTRKMTVYGKRMTDRIVGDLAEVGCLIVGGMADGVDACAHRVALERKGRTVAVLPCGIDVIYPQSQYNMYWDIAENGCVVSEFLPGMRPLGAHFQIRNRLIAGFSNGVLHVQSPEKSGSLITTKWAVQYNRDVFAVPGDADVTQSEGPNQLIQCGAKLVTGAMDILEEYGYLFAGHELPAKPEDSRIQTPPSEQMQAIIKVLIEEDLDMSSIAIKTGLDLTNVILLLTDMQIQGIISEKPGGLYQLSKTFTI